MPSPKNIAAAYARYSTDKQCSIAIQIQRIAEYCQAHDLSLSREHVYYDEGKSGTSTAHRRGYQDMVAAAHRHEFSCIVLYDLTRGSRDVADWFNFRKEMRKLGIQVISTMDNLGDIDKPSDFLTELLTVGIGRHAVLQAREKSMDKVDELAKEGKFLGGFAPYGYRVESGAYIINEDEAEHVRMIWEMYAHGESYDSILAALPHGIRGRRGRPFGKNTLYTILNNKRYLGVYSWCEHQSKYFSEWMGGGPSPRAVRIEDGMPAIVDKKIGKMVEKRMSENKIKNGNHTRPDREYLLTGLLICKKCGAAYVGTTTTNKKGYEYKSYKCGNKYRTKTCDAKNLPAKDIEPFIAKLVRESILSGRMAPMAADAVCKSGHSRNTPADLPQLWDELEARETQMANLVKALGTGLDSQYVRDEVGHLENEIRLLKAKIETLEVTGGSLNREDILASFEADAVRLKDDPACIKEMIHKYITRIEVSDDEIAIHSIADLHNGLALDLPDDFEAKKIQPQENLETVNNTGCGGAFLSLYTITLSRSSLTKLNLKIE